MSNLDTFLFFLAILAILLGLFLSRSGTGGGIGAISGQEIELFKRQKSRGAMKYISIAMFLVTLIIIIVVLVLYLQNNAPAPTPEPQP